MNFKKGEMGIGTLIIFIALLLVAAIAAGVLIQTSGSLQERALMTGDQAKSQISTNIRVIEVAGTDGSNGTIDTFSEIIQLSAGSDAIKLTQALLTLNTYDMTGSLTFRGTSAICNHSVTNGFYTLGPNEMGYLNGSLTGNFYELSDDFNADGKPDYLAWDDSATTMYVNISADTGYTLVTIPSIADCSGATVYTINGSNYTATSNDYIDKIYIDGQCYNSTIPKSTKVTVYPKTIGSGYFTITYMQRGSNPVDGNLQRGDVVKLCYESPRAIGEDETIRINFIPKVGTPTLTKFITPEVMSTERVYLYP